MSVLRLIETKSKYVLYDDNGKVLVYTSNKRIALHMIEKLTKKKLKGKKNANANK